MKQNGFGLTEMLIFIVTSLVILVVCVIVYNKNFNNENSNLIDDDIMPQIVGEKNEEVDKIEEIEEKESEEKLSREEKKYKELLDKMVNTAKIYVSSNYIGKTEQIIIKVSQLVDEEYMDELVDPKDNKNICTGYVIYNGEDEYIPYLNCNKNYKSEKYDSSFE